MRLVDSGSQQMDWSPSYSCATINKLVGWSKYMRKFDLTYDLS